MNNLQKVNVFNFAFDYLFGSLWWGRESFIVEHVSGWHESDRYGHPLLSLRKEQIHEVFEEIPMLAGTSGKGRLTIIMNENRKTDFSTAVCAHGIVMDDFIWHSEEKGNLESAVRRRRKIWQNVPKTHVTADERSRVEDFLKSRRYAALNNGGYNK